MHLAGVAKEFSARVAPPRAWLALDMPHSKTQRKAIFNRTLISNRSEICRRRMKTKRGRKRQFDPDIFQELFRAIKRVFAWENKFRRLLLRLKRISAVHYALETLAYTMINLRHFWRG